MGRGARQDQASAVGRFVTRKSLRYRGARLDEPDQEMPEVAWQAYRDLEEQEKLIVRRGDGDRRPSVDSRTHADGAYLDALCAYELMKQQDPDDEKALNDYYQEIKSMLAASSKWINGDYESNDTGSWVVEYRNPGIEPYQVKYGYPDQYTPEALAQPGGWERAQQTAADMNQENREVADKLNRWSDRWENSDLRQALVNPPNRF